MSSQARSRGGSGAEMGWGAVGARAGTAGPREPLGSAGPRAEGPQ